MQFFNHEFLALTTDDARPVSSMMMENKELANITLRLVTKSECFGYCLNGELTDCQNSTCSDGLEAVKSRTKVEWWLMETMGGGLNGRKEINNEIIIISDKTGPESLSWLTGYGVIGLYLSVVLLCGRYTRAIFQYDGAYIMFHEYPNVDDMIQLCLGQILYSC